MLNSDLAFLAPITFFVILGWIGIGVLYIMERRDRRRKRQLWLPFEKKGCKH